MIQEITTLFIRDLNKLKEELKSYDDEEAIWKTEEGISNCTGNLALHLIGNLNHFIGTILGQTGFVRNRDAEFSEKNIPVSSLLSQIDETINMIREVLASTDDPGEDEVYPIAVFGGPIKTRAFLLHLYGHLNYHLGQINYHRRILG